MVVDLLCLVGYVVMSGARRADTRSADPADCTEDPDQGREEDAGSSRDCSGTDTAGDAASCSAGVDADADDAGSAEDAIMVSVDEDDASDSVTSSSNESSEAIPAHPRRLRLSVSSGPEARPQDDGKVGGRDIGGGRAEGAAGAAAGATAGDALEGDALEGGAPEGSAAIPTSPASPAIPATLSPSFAHPRPSSTPPDRARSSDADTGSREASHSGSVLRRMNTAPDLRAASRTSERENSAHSSSWHNLAQGASWVSSLDKTHLEALYLPAWRRRARERWRKAINQVKVANYMKVVWKSTSEE